MEAEKIQKNILIVDDIQFSAWIVEKMLAQCDYKTRICTDPLDALNILTNGALPDLVLLDLMMPGINGFEFLERIRNNTKTSDIPIVVLSALNDKDSKDKAMELGAIDYVTKPINMDVLLNAVKNVLEK